MERASPVLESPEAERRDLADEVTKMIDDCASGLGDSSLQAAADLEEKCSSSPLCIIETRTMPRIVQLIKDVDCPEISAAVALIVSKLVNTRPVSGARRCSRCSFQNAMEFVNADGLEACTEIIAQGAAPDLVIGHVLDITRHVAETAQFTKRVERAFFSAVATRHGRKRAVGFKQSLKVEIRRLLMNAMDDLPRGFECPITFEVMQNPVMASDGFTYEKSAIDALLTAEAPRSPMTRERLDRRTTDNKNLKMGIFDLECKVSKIMRKRRRKEFLSTHCDVCENAGLSESHQTDCSSS